MTLHMLHLEVSGAGLARFAHDRRLPSEDEGYLLHRLLRDAFGEIAPQPFRFFLPAGRRPGRLLGYGTRDAAALREALAVAEPLLDAALPPSGILGKGMPGGSARVSGSASRSAPARSSAPRVGTVDPDRARSTPSCTAACASRRSSCHGTRSIGRG